eukprot:9201539-Ditylum_brightwellii.AAC.1
MVSLLRREKPVITSMVFSPKHKSGHACGSGNKSKNNNTAQLQSFEEITVTVISPHQTTATSRESVFVYERDDVFYAIMVAVGIHEHNHMNAERGEIIRLDDEN